MNENIEVLEEVLDVLEEEKRKFYNLINQNEFRIEEINSYLKELSKREDEDFKVFSPRNAENIHRKQIEADISEMKKYEDENAEYNKKIEALKVLIDKVNIVIGNLQYFSEDEEKILKDFNNKYDVENFENKKINNGKENSLADTVEYSEKNNEKIVDIKENVREMEREYKLEKKHIAHQILNCVSYIVPDTERAKIELTAISKKLIE